MADVIFDTLLDGIKLVPFLYLTYLAMEFLEHKTSAKTKNMVKNSGKAGPLIGALLGAFPQCGFSTVASNLYAGRVITLGTLVAIFLSTSDEMIPVFLSENVSIITLLKIVGAKVVIGLVMGFAIDFFLRKQRRVKYDMMSRISNVCSRDMCGCGKNIWLSALRHSVTVFAYIIVISFALNTVIFMIGEDTLGSLILNKPVIGPLIAGLVGLIPNCAASVVLTQLYLGGVMSLGAMMAGLLGGAGVGLLVLFKENSSLKENLSILALLYSCGVVWGIVIDFVAMFI